MLRFLAKALKQDSKVAHCLKAVAIGSGDKAVAILNAGQFKPAPIDFSRFPSWFNFYKLHK